MRKYSTNTMKKYVVMLTLICTVLSLAGCSPAESVAKYIENGDIEKAESIYSKKIDGDREQESEVANQIEAYIETIVQDYNQGIMTYDTAISILNQIEEFDYCNENILWNAVFDIECLSKSKEAYDEAMLYMEETENADSMDLPCLYENAMLQFINMNQGDSLYDSAAEKFNEAKQLYVKSILSNTDSMRNSGNYLEASSLLENAEDTMWYLLTIYDENGDFLVSENDFAAAFSEQMEKIYGDYFNAAFEEATAIYQRTGDPLEAGRIIENAEDCATYCIEGVTEEIDKYYRLYLDKVISEARSVFSDGNNYEAAIAVLRNAIGEIGENEELRAEIEKYQEYEPVALCSLSYTKKSEYIEIGTDRSEIYTDVSENTYEPESVICRTYDDCASWGDGPDSLDEIYLNYYLNSKYSKLTGYVYRPYDTLSCTSTWKNETTVRIYGDGSLLYEAPYIDQKSYDPIEFEINVTGIRELNICVSGTWTSKHEWYGFNVIHPRVCLANMYLTR